MKARGAAVMGALAATALGAAYLTWQRPKEAKTDNTVKVLEASKTSLAKIRYEDATRFTEVTRVVGDSEPVIWLKQGFLEGKAPVFDAGTPSADGGTVAAPLPPVATPTRELRANERGDKTWEKFTPFEAVRALGQLSDAKLKELSLDQSPKLLTLTVAGTDHRFRVSNPTAGFVGQYVLDEKTKEVYLLSSGALSEVEPSSTTLVDRRLHAFKQPDFDAFTVTLPDGQKKEFVQTDASIPQTAKVAPKASPDKPDEYTKNWHDKVWNRMIVTEVLGKGEQPAQGAPLVMAKVEYFSKGRPKGWIEIARVNQVATLMYARTENTAGWVALHTGVEEMILEAQKVVTGH
ncbi:MAG: hypothetical protein JNK82_11115 [Myxococcaceae bacterium]|nr:hypothetical protein [Myxococcaceae bacterium]